jgi:F-type H+-transporting ATPase subunit epsilon
MSNGPRVQLKILVPSGVFAIIAKVERIVVMTLTGSFGLLPHRVDCAAVLPAGLFTYSTSGEEEVHLAVDAGVMIKTGPEVLVCVRRVIAGASLGQLRQAVLHELMKQSEQDSSNRKRMAQLEGGLIRDFVKLQRA